MNLPVLYVSRIGLIVFLALFTLSCADSEPSIYTLSGRTMGTSYTIKIVVREDLVNVADLKQSIDEVLSQVDAAMSTYKDDSELSRFNQSGVGLPFVFSTSTFGVIEYAHYVSTISSGAFDITVGPLVSLWGFGADGAIHNPPADAKIASLLKNIGFSNLVMNASQKSVTKKQDLQIDLSAIAKGYAVDKVAEVIELSGVENYLVEVGGETRTKGVNQAGSVWRLGVEKPDVTGRSVVSVVEVPDMALATSGDYRNFFVSNGKRYSHTISPTTGRPVEHNLASVSVLAESCMEADALATALLVMGEEKGYNFAQEHKLKAYFIYRDQDAFQVRITDGFKPYLL